jgi:hypothetical protein
MICKSLIYNHVQIINGIAAHIVEKIPENYKID